MENLEEEKINIRKLETELSDLGFDEEQSKKILEWVDTIPIRVYGDNISVIIKNGVVRINEDLVDINDLSFNKLSKDLRIYYSWDNGKFYNPFNIPDGAILYNLFTGEGLRHNKNGPPTPATDINGEKIQMNPWSGKICGKFLYENGKPIKRWIVNDDNEWEEKELEFPKNKE